MMADTVCSLRNNSCKPYCIRYRSKAGVIKNGKSIDADRVRKFEGGGSGKNLKVLNYNLIPAFKSFTIILFKIMGSNFTKAFL